MIKLSYISVNGNEGIKGVPEAAASRGGGASPAVKGTRAAPELWVERRRPSVSAVKPVRPPAVIRAGEGRSRCGQLGWYREISSRPLEGRGLFQFVDITE